MIRIGIVGYGNLGKGVEAAITQNPDMELVAIFSRRAHAGIKPKDATVKVLHVSEAKSFKDRIDVMVLCGGSATDLPEQGPEFVKMFNTVDSFDTHAKIPEYFDIMNKTAKASGKIGIISVGWDPGLFSMNRVLTEAVVPRGKTYTFWGRGVSQGHSDAIRRVKGVKAAVQYTIPVEDAVQKVRNGENPNLTTREKHFRHCYVVAEEGVDKTAIETAIKKMPNYFADYDTRVTFISEEELKRDHSAMPHGGFVIHSGSTADDSKHIVEFSLKLESNPMFTASVILAYARAAYKLNIDGQNGAKTVLDVPLSYLSSKPASQLRKEFL